MNLYDILQFQPALKENPKTPIDDLMMELGPVENFESSFCHAYHEDTLTHQLNLGNLPDLVIAVDCDGVLTDNAIRCHRGEGFLVNSRKFYMSDGHGIRIMTDKFRTRFVCVTSSKSRAVEERCIEMGFYEGDILQGCDNKAESFKAYAERRGIDLNQTVYIGNDLNDESLLKIVKFPMIPRETGSPILAVRMFASGKDFFYIKQISPNTGHLRSLIEYLMAKRYSTMTLDEIAKDQL